MAQRAFRMLASPRACCSDSKGTLSHRRADSAPEKNVRTRLRYHHMQSKNGKQPAKFSSLVTRVDVCQFLRATSSHCCSTTPEPRLSKSQPVVPHTCSRQSCHVFTCADGNTKQAHLTISRADLEVSEETLNLPSPEIKPCLGSSVIISPSIYRP